MLTINQAISVIAKIFLIILVLFFGTEKKVEAQDFQIGTLTDLGCIVVDHNSVTGDERGGIAVSSSQVFYTGDNSTGRFSNTDLTGCTYMLTKGYI